MSPRRQIPMKGGGMQLMLVNVASLRHSLSQKRLYHFFRLMKDIMRDIAQQYLSLAENISLQTHFSYFMLRLAKLLMQKLLYQQ